MSAMTAHTLPTDFEAPGLGYIETEAEFRITGSRDREHWDVDATFLRIEAGGLTITRTLLVLMLGEAEVLKIEENAATEWAEKHSADWATYQKGLNK
jgi:hypothetical protein